MTEPTWQSKEPVVVTRSRPLPDHHDSEPRDTVRRVMIKLLLLPDEILRRRH